MRLNGLSVSNPFAQYQHATDDTGVLSTENHDMAVLTHALPQ